VGGNYLGVSTVAGWPEERVWIEQYVMILAVGGSTKNMGSGLWVDDVEGKARKIINKPVLKIEENTEAVI